MEWTFSDGRCDYTHLENKTYLTSLINNGTGFYEKEKEGLTLHTHIGFKENRAIFFDSTIYHSPLLFAGNSGPRYAMANWIGV